MRAVLYRTQARTRQNWGLSDGARRNPTGEVAQARRSLTKRRLGFINPWNLKCNIKVVWIGIEEKTAIFFEMMNLDSSIFYFGFWEVNYEHLGCFLPVKALFWARESSKMCVFWPRKVGNVTVQICNISRMAWRNAMIFLGGGNRHYIFDFRWFLSQTRW